MTIKKHQVLDFLYLISNDKIVYIYEKGDLSDLGIDTTPIYSINLVIPQKPLSNLTPDQIKEATKLLIKYNHIFAKSDTDLGIYKNLTYTMILKDIFQ